MIDPDKRKAIYLLHQEGMGFGEIARNLSVDRHTVRTIVSQQGEIPESSRKDKIEIDPELLRQLYAQCQGWVQRIHEILAEEHHIQIGYSTLTRQIRTLELNHKKNSRCDQVPDEPGTEMQHDTSPYRHLIGDKVVPVIASLIYYRYSKIRYLKFYRSFNRFNMKCFFHEALTFWQYAAQHCIIDNTNLARLRGSGKNAVIVPEMMQFSQQYGFDFRCHEIKHSNRKAGNERGFFTVETNFFPGRTFASIEDLNQQALEWATVRLPNRPVGKAGLIPAKAFEYEQAFLIKLLSMIPAPSQPLNRVTDQYGYVAFDGNFYWIPGTRREDVTLLQYSECLKIYLKRQLLVEYALPAVGVKNQKFAPPGQPAPKYRPNNRKQPTAEEEKRLRAVAVDVDAYLTMVLKPMGLKKHRFLRQLYVLHKKLDEALFIKTIQRATKYRIDQFQTLEQISFLLLQEGHYQLPDVTVNPESRHRTSYLEGRFSDEPDLSAYDQLIEDDNE